MTLSVLPSNRVRDDGNAMVVLVALPNRAVTWSIAGAGTLTVITSRTDAAGRAYCRYNPGGAGGTATITAEYGA